MSARSYGRNALGAGSIPAPVRSGGMRVFLDFEASSLGKNGYPIEVAWVFEDGDSESFLISPIGRWTGWDAAAEAIHGISREQLAAEG